MKRFIKNCLIFIIPFGIYLLIIFLINPFNYKDYNILKRDRKEWIAASVEPHLYKIIKYENEPTKNILLGDSRTNELARHIQSDDWTNMAYGGGSLKEVIQTFWWATEVNELDTVIIGINLNLYNRYNKRFWVEETLDRKKNFFSYAFSKYAFRATAITIKTSFSDKEINFYEPPMSREAFWEYQINETAAKFYEKFEYPDEYFKELQEISTYCTEKNIKLIIWIPPNHIEFQNRMADFGLEEMNMRFISDMKSIAELYDFNFDSELTRNKEDYDDPMHFDFDIGVKVYQDIFFNAKKYSKHYIKTE